MTKTLTLVIAAALLMSARQGSAYPKPAETPQVQDASLIPLVERRFASWDRNHDGILELEEVDREIENHNVRGLEAAVIYQIRRHLTAKGSEARISRDELLKLAKDRAFEKSVDTVAKRLETIDREVFLPTDPDLATFHQGRLGDCYLLSTIAAEAHRRPKALRNMIHPQVSGDFEVDFPNGEKIKVPPITGCELLIGARMDSKHGSWLAVLEKAYGIIRERDRELARKTNKSAKASEIVPAENLGGGSCPPIISLLTGHQATSLVLRKTADSEEVHQLLVDLIKKRRLICVGEHVENDKHPPGIVNHHCYGLLGYDSKLRQLTLFNPWGNTFKPKGSPGIANGYSTEQGVFIVPLDEFRQVFSALNYETDKPLAK